jgi:hypothetical protein
MAEVHTIFSSESEQIERVYRRLEEQNAKLIAQNRMLHNESRQQHQETMGFLGQQISTIGQMAMSYFTVQSAISGVMTAYHDWDAVVNRLAKNHEKLADNALKAISAAGDLAAGPKVEEFIEHGKGGTRETRIAAYRGATGGNPAATLEQRLAIAQAAAKANVLVDDLPQFARLASEVQKDFPGMSADQAANFAFAVKSRAGAHAGELTSDSALRAAKTLMESGAVKDASHAFGFELAGLHANVDPAMFTRIAAAVEQHLELKKPGTGQPYTEADRAFNKFARSDAAERLHLLMTDEMTAETMLGKRAFPNLRLIKPDAVEKEASALSSENVQGYIDRSLAAAGQTKSGATEIAEHQTAARYDALPELRKAELDDARIKRVSEWFSKMVDVMDPDGPNWLEKTTFKAWYRVQFGKAHAANRRGADGG